MRERQAWMSRAAWAGYAVLLLLAPLVWTSSLAHTLLSQMGIAIIACLSYNLLFGQGGMLSFGHAVYSGTGAFLAIHTLRLVGQGDLALPVSLLPVAGGLAAAALALVFVGISTRRAATTFAMITLGVGELVWAVALMFPGVFGGEAGISGNRVAGPRPWGISLGPGIELYYLIAAYTFGCTLLLYLFTRTPLGRLLNAVRDNAERVEFLGFSAPVVRGIAFVVAAFFAGVSGGLAALLFEIVTTEVLGAARSGALLLFTFLGGSTVFYGPIIGGVLMVLAFALLSELTRAWLLYLGLLFMLMVMVAPGGLASLVVLGARLLAHRATRALLPRLLGSGLRLGLCAALALLGLGALVEMAYHRQLGATLGNDMRYLGVVLDVGHAPDWALAGALALLGGALSEWARRGFARRWRAVQAGLDAVSPARGDAP